MRRRSTIDVVQKVATVVNRISEHLFRTLGDFSGDCVLNCDSDNGLLMGELISRASGVSSWAPRYVISSTMANPRERCPRVKK